LIVNDDAISQSVTSVISNTITPPSPIIGTDTLVPTTTMNMIGLFELAQTYDMNKDSISYPKIQIVNYQQGNYHPYMKIEQAI
jgi:beta-glucanase (GH16 family)